MKKILLTSLVLLLVNGFLFAQSTIFNSPISGCPMGQDSVVYQSTFNVNNNDWKLDTWRTPTNPLGIWEWGVPASGNEVCDFQCSANQPISVPAPPNSNTNMWITNLNGCYSNAAPQNSGASDTMFLYKRISFEGIAPPVQLTLQHMTETYGPDDITLLIDGQALFREQNDVQGWQDLILDASNPQGLGGAEFVDMTLLDNKAGDPTVIVAVGFYVSSQCNFQGEVISNLGIRGCKVSAAPTIPTMSEWGLILLSLFLLTFSTLFIAQRQKTLALANSNETIKVNKWTKPPFHKKSFLQSLVFAIVLAALVFIGSFFAFNYSITLIDAMGLVLALPLFAYLVHLWINFNKAA